MSEPVCECSHTLEFHDDLGVCQLPDCECQDFESTCCHDHDDNEPHEHAEGGCCH